MLLRCCEDELWGSPQRLPDAASQRVPHNCHTIARQDPEALKRSPRFGQGHARLQRCCFHACFAETTEP